MFAFINLKRLTALSCSIALSACAQLGTTHTSTTDQPVKANANLPDPLAAGWDGKPVCEQIALTTHQRVLRCTFPPGVGHERHFHAPHFGYALSGGRMQITDSSGVRVVDLSTSSHYTSEGTAWHEVVNVGKTTVQYLIIEPL